MVNFGNAYNGIIVYFQIFVKHFYEKICLILTFYIKKGDIITLFELFLYFVGEYTVA